MLQLTTEHQLQLSIHILPSCDPDHTCSSHSEGHPVDHDYCTVPTVKNTKLQQGYRFNVDNLDFLIRARNMTQDHQNQTKHYVQLMAIQDRVNCEHFINDRPLGNLSEVPYQDFIPSGDDNYSLRKDIIHVVAEIIIDNLESFKVFKGVINKGFHHQFSGEMKQKSVVVYTFLNVKSRRKC